MSSRSPATASNLTGGLILADKPAGMGSSALVGKIKQYTGYKKAGHAGTLDRFAEGLMLVMVGKSTVFSDYLLHLDKSYNATVTAGISTDTLDPEGSVTEKWPEEKIQQWFESSENLDRLKMEVEKMTLVTRQKPPLFSAVKIKGKRASDRTRAGEKIELNYRNVKIYRSELVAIDRKHFTFNARFEVSSGTYIRSIVNDLSEILGLPMHLSQLKRLSVGSFSLKSASWTPEVQQFNKDCEVLSPDHFLAWPTVKLDSHQIERLSNGIFPSLSATQYDSIRNVGTNFLLLDPDRIVAAWAIKNSTGKMQLKRVLCAAS